MDRKAGVSVPSGRALPVELERATVEVSAQRERKGQAMKQDSIELIVDEPIDGHFYWMLLEQERAGTAPRTVDSAPGPLPSYSAAMMAGISALQQRSRGYGLPLAAVADKNGPGRASYTRH